MCDADCSLREAIAAASPGDSIQFASPLFDSPQIIALNGQIVIDKSLTITGKGAALTAVKNVAAANAATRVFLVSVNQPVILSKMTVSGGRVDLFDPNSVCAGDTCGAEIQNNGNLTLNEMFFTGRRVSGTIDNGVRVDGAENLTVGNYPNTNIALSGNTTVTPDAAPTDTTYATATTSSDFKGKLDVNPATGIVRVTNAHPAGTYNVTVNAYSGGQTATKTFTLTVTTPAGCGSFDTSAFARTDYSTGASSTGPLAVAAADFNGDGRQDIVAANAFPGINTVSVFLRNGTNDGFDPKVDYPAGNRPQVVEVGDLNGDGRQDIIAGNRDGHISILFRNAGNNGFDAPLSLTVADVVDFLVIGDLNGDGRPDIGATTIGTGIISVFYRNSDNTGFDPRVDLTAALNPNGAAIADFNGDGRADLIVVGAGGTASILYRNASNTAFDPAVNITLPTNNAVPVAAGDFNGDGRQDFAVAYYISNLISVYLRKADNSGFDAPVNLTVNTFTSSIAVGDFNGDGRQDIATVNSVAGAAYVLLRSADNTGFDSPVSFGVGSSPQSIAVGDFNGDNRQDLVAANANSNNLSVLTRVCDSIPPDTTITANPVNPSNSSSASFSFTGTDDQTPSGSLIFECSLDNAAFSACASPQNYTNLSDGDHSFAVRAKDQTGNLDPTPASFSWTIDTNAPTVSLTSAAPDPTAAAFSVTATFSEPVSGFDLSEISVANGSASSLTGGGNLYTFTVTPTAPGTVSAFVIAGAAQDAAGNGNSASNQLTRRFNDQSVLVVTKTADTDDGVCNADCSLREAISAATSGTTIGFAPLFNSPQTIALTNGDLLIDKNLTINGTGANRLTVSGNDASRIFRIINTTASISGLTVARGNADNGGGIFSFGSQLTINGCVVAGNSTTGNAGGIYSINGTLDLLNSTVSGNAAAVIGGGIANGGAPGVVNVTNSTISGNSAQSGGGIFTNSTVTVRSSTITANSATNEGGGISNFTTELVSLGNTIIAENYAPTAPDFRDTLTSLGYNLIGNTSGANITGLLGGNILNQNPRLLPLGNYGGTTPTHVLLPDSPAINNGTDTGAPSTDQRGRARVGQVDIGAFEAQFNLVVTNTADSGAGSLRAAIAAANSSPTDETITFSIPSTDPGCVVTVCTIRLTSGELVINSSSTAGSLMIIKSFDAANIIISGNNASRVFSVSSGANLTLGGVTVTGGNSVGTTQSFNGGGIYNGGAVNLSNSTVSGNSAGNNGGGIYNAGTLTLTNSTVSGNSAPNDVGGGIYNAGTSTLTNSTVSGNSAAFLGGGIFNFSSTQVNARNTMIAGNAAGNAGPDFIGPLTSQGNNLIGNTANTTITGTTTGNILNQNPLLAPLGFYGGQTMTHALLSGSPAINAGTFAGAPAADQRGAARVGNVDIGAFELNNSANGGNYRAVLPVGRQNTAYSYSLIPASGAIAFSLTGGALPDGVNLTSAFAPAATVSVAGTPTQAGTFNFSITASDGLNTNVTDYQLKILVPTAAGVSIGGRVLTGKRGLANAIVALTKSDGTTLTTRTGSFGYYRFDDIAAGETVLVTVVSKRFTFAPQVVSVSDNIADLDFAASPE
ncbi:MAG: VCBS repeat-containing protein [Acidobacteria bacterium]|nr:VCBS repeat-containing protein [Acidobacteriota bacterium]